PSTGSRWTKFSTLVICRASGVAGVMPAKSLNCGSWERAGIDMLNGPSAAWTAGEASPPVSRQANRAKKKWGKPDRSLTERGLAESDIERLTDIARLRGHSLLFLCASWIGHHAIAAMPVEAGLRRKIARILSSRLGFFAGPDVRNGDDL